MLSSLGQVLDDLCVVISQSYVRYIKFELLSGFSLFVPLIVDLLASLLNFLFNILLELLTLTHYTGFVVVIILPMFVLFQF